MTRGDVVIVRFPFADGRGGKNRPALVVQNDRDNRRLTQTVVAMITGNLRFASESTQLLIDPATPEGKAARLHGPSVVKCCNLFTISQQDVIRTIGKLPDSLLAEVNVRLKAALQLD